MQGQAGREEDEIEDVDPEDEEGDERGELSLEALLMTEGPLGQQSEISLHQSGSIINSQFRSE